MNLSNCRLLIVDDEPEILGLIRSALEPLGANLSFAENGLVAAECIARTRFDIILTDIRMPEIDGFRLGSLVKTSHLNQHAKIIVLAGFVDEERAQKCDELGVVEALEKPFRPRQLLHIISKHLEPQLKSA